MGSNGTYTSDRLKGGLKRREGPQQPQLKQGGKERGRVRAVAEARRKERQELVLVEWEDSFGCSPSWESLEGVAPTPLVCRSVGWLIYDSDGCKVIVPHLTQAHASAKPQGCGDMTIPTRAILSIHRLAIKDRIHAWK